MNIGKWIVVAFVLFAAFIGTLVTVCVRQDISLVSKDYYQEELLYQDQIKRISNTRALIDKPLIARVDPKTLAITFSKNVEQGELKLFCPSDQKMDKNFTLSATESKQTFDIGTLKPGMYRARLYWTADGQPYFIEEIIYL